MPRSRKIWSCIAGAAVLTIAAIITFTNQDPPKIPIVWHVNPETGDDRQSGSSPSNPWKTFQPLNKIALSPGHRVVIHPGHHTHSLIPQALGSPTQPVKIEFLPGVHEFSTSQATRRQYYISNSVTSSVDPMPIAILVRNCEHLELAGAGTSGDGKTTLLMNGRMTHFINDRSATIHYRDLVFDLKRPTVSEFRVMESGDHWSDIQIAESSTHIYGKDGIRWTGDLGSGTYLTQQAIPEEGRAWRTGTNNSPLTEANRIEPRGDGRFRLHFDDRDPLSPGHQYQIRFLDRDIVGAHNVLCRDIDITDCVFHAFTGMGIISQFTENIRYERVSVAPPKGTLRTCAAWADAFHFSSCRGDITIKDCTFSGTQDDPVNVHGTHLLIAEWVNINQFLVRYKHKQTYGFPPYLEGDEVAVIHSPTLREYPDNPRRTVTNVEKITEHDWLVTFDNAAPHFVAGDVLDNLSWNPDVTILNCTVDMCPTRGFLCTTRGKVLIEGNTLTRCHMPGILIEGDASGWFESGPVRDMTIRGNTFIGCDIRIHPQVKEGNEPVHENITISGNTFTEGAGIRAHHTSGLIIENNLSDGDPIPIKLDANSTTSTVRDNP